MKILITNIRVAQRSGTEIVTSDLAQRLLERGHDVAVYTPEKGPLADELTSKGVLIVDSLLDVPFAPDVIHGHHTPTTAEAIIAFPMTPAIWVCHGAASWFDRPPRFSQIKRIFAVDETCKARLVNSDHIPADHRLRSCRTPSICGASYLAQRHCLQSRCARWQSSNMAASNLFCSKRASAQI